MSREDEIVELEVKYITDLPAGSKGIITSLPFPGWKAPEPITKQSLEEFKEQLQKRGY